ncbi:arylsulfotransferase family protein [Rhodotorula paludigena]|uniref:arylsulfotransferase family protein n=1 Tax=Rhodotorula paludigena TaxID=86838 RepID=UPI00317CC7FF
MLSRPHVPLCASLAALSFVLPRLASADSVVTDNSTSWYATTAPVQTFHSSNVTPPEWNVLTLDAERVSEGSVLLSYRGTATSQAAPLIMDNNGSLVWSGAEAGYGDSMDLIVQQYKGEDVLTDFYSGGYGYGYWNILSTNYSLIRTVSSLNQTEDESDFHEFVITENNTALVESWRTTQADLTGAGGDGIGWTWDCVFQEIDISGASRESDELLFEWRALDHMDAGESYFQVENNGNSSDNAFDFCHINSVEKVAATGDYLISMRGPSTIYLINGQTGEITWRLSGKYSNFTMGENATFWYQHDARLMEGQDITSGVFNISLFDNAAGGGEPAEATARALVLQLDTNAWTATLVREDIPSFDAPAASQGSNQPLDDGSFFVGWGAQPYFTEYAPDGTIVQDVTFGTTESVVMSYRAFKQTWHGYPLTNPTIAVNGSSAFVSWNGATDVASWTLLGGTSESGVTNEVSTLAKSGFETEIANIGETYSYLAAAAVASDGTCLGVSAVYSTASLSSTSTNGTCPSGSTVAPAGTNGTSTASGSNTSTDDESGAGRIAASVAVAGAAAVAALFAAL